MTSLPHLIAALRGGTATEAQRREYARRLDALREPHDCEHGHEDCAVTPRGPCSDQHRPQEGTD